MPGQKLIAFVLAAGASSRFGSAKFKAVLPEGGTLLQRAISQAASVNPAKIIVVSGAWTIHKNASPLEFEVIHHANWEFGMDASVYFAAQKLVDMEDTTAMLLLPCDMPFVPLPHLKKLTDALLVNRKSWAATGYEKGPPGIPLAWSRGFCKRILADTSIKPRQFMAMMHSEGETIFSAGDFSDIDRPEDLPRK